MKNKKAISLIVLIITIIVMIILASAIIMSLDNANIFNKAEEAVDKTNAATNKYLSEIKLAERELEKIQGPSKVTDENPGVLSGKGTTEEPYLIESIEDLVEFSEMVNSGEETFEGKTVKLTKLLDFNSDNSYVNPKIVLDLDGNGDNATIKEELTTGNGFIPIGIGSSGTTQKELRPFKGTFDGDGAEIRNLYINGSELKVSTGLFGYAKDANIKNIGVTGKIIPYGYTGPVIAEINSNDKEVKIENCYSKVNMDILDDGNAIGGICGGAFSYNEYKIMITDCYNLGRIGNENITNGEFGGIIGTTDGVVINRCYNLGSIKAGENVMIGGIVCSAYYSKIINCYNAGTIVVKKTASCAGIVAYVSETDIVNSYNAGKVISLQTSLESAGLSSMLSVGSKMINCVNIGEVDADAELIEEYFDGDTHNLYSVNPNLVDIARGTPSEATKQLDLNRIDEQIAELNEEAEKHEGWLKWKKGPQGYPILDM